MIGGKGSPWLFGQNALSFSAVSTRTVVMFSDTDDTAYLDDMFISIVL